MKLVGSNLKIGGYYLLYSVPIDSPSNPDIVGFLKNMEVVKVLNRGVSIPLHSRTLCHV